MLIAVSIVLHKRTQRLTAVYTVDGRKRDKQGQVSLGVVYAVHRKHDGRNDGRCILATVDQVRKGIAGIFISTKAL
jgi:hypothetical protein